MILEGDFRRWQDLVKGKCNCELEKWQGKWRGEDVFKIYCKLESVGFGDCVKGEGEKGVKTHVTRTQEKENVLRKWREVLFCTEMF